MKSTIINSLVCLSGALLLMGCASSDYDDEGYKVTTTETTTTADSEMDYPGGSVIKEPSGAEPAQTAQSGNEWVIPLHEEQMNVGKRQVDSGEVTLRKVVTSEQVSQPVELRKETLTIEREPAGASSEAVSSAEGNLFEEQAVTIQLQEEQPVVEKTIVRSGQVTARKDAQISTQEVKDEIRREKVEVDRGNAGGAVTYEGFSENEEMSAQEINEAAGAERPEQHEADE